VQVAADTAAATSRAAATPSHSPSDWCLPALTMSSFQKTLIHFLLLKRIDEDMSGNALCANLG